MKLFNNDLIEQIHNLNVPDTDEIWDIKRAAEGKIYDIIHKAVAYGIKEGLQGIMDEYELNNKIK